MKKNIIEFMSFLLIIFALILIGLSAIRITYFDMSLLNYSYHLIFIGVLGFIVYIISKIKNVKFNKYEIIIFVLAFLAGLSCLGAINLHEALWGRIGRYEGLFVILTYYVLCLLACNIQKKHYIKIILGGIVVIGLSNIIYGLFQVDILPNFFQVKNKWIYARGFQGNSMFFSSLMSICYPLILGSFLKEKNKKKAIWHYFLLILLTIGVVISGGMSCYVAIFLVFLLAIFDFLYRLFKKDDSRKVIIMECGKILLCIITFVMVYLVIIKNNETLQNDVLELVHQTSSVSKGNVSDNFGTGRIYIWRNTLEKIQENYLFGVGIDNFYNAFNPPLIDPISYLPVAKAHNEYLQIMLCEGVLKGIIYICFLLMIFFKNLFKKKNSLCYALFLSFVSYAIQAFFNISVIRIAPLFFIVMGLLVSVGEKSENINHCANI